MRFNNRFLITPGDSINLGDLATRHSGIITKTFAEKRTQRIVSRLADLQYLLYANDTDSLLVVLEGPDAAGKDGLVRHVFGGLNPQGVKVTPFSEPSTIEAKHDFLWRIHSCAPAKGEIAVFNRSHYEAVLVERVRDLVPRATWQQRYAMINAFEELLAQNGTKTLKFYLHISAEEQLERFRRRMTDRQKRWKISEADYADRELWHQFQEAGNEMLTRTSTDIAPWYVVPSDEKWFRNYAIARIILKTMKRFHLPTPQPRADLSKIKRDYHGK